MMSQTAQNINFIVDNDINVLIYYKREYEKYDDLSKANQEMRAKRDSLYNKYLQKANKIQKAPQEYLQVITSAIDNKRVESKEPGRILYNYVNTALPFDPDLNFVTRLELYKLVKKYIIDQKGALPRRTQAYMKVGNDDSSYKPINKAR